VTAGRDRPGDRAGRLGQQRGQLLRARGAGRHHDADGGRHITVGPGHRDRDREVGQGDLPARHRHPGLPHLCELSPQLHGIHDRQRREPRQV
jgi:hypothetical protein